MAFKILPPAEETVESKSAQRESYSNTSSSNCSNSSYSENSWMMDSENDACSNCSVGLQAPFIYCDECNLNICTDCFRTGSEFSSHKSDHNYRVITDDFYLYENSDWTAKEELTLLEAILRYGNWPLIATKFPNRTEKEVQEHYEHYYMHNPIEPLPKFKETTASMFPEPLVPYQIRIGNTEDPPRYLPHHIGCTSLSGYNAARADFEVEYDRSAEALIANLKEIDPNHPHYEILTELQYGIIRIYNNRLHQREKRKMIIRNHGLICYRKVAAWLYKYNLTITRPVYMKFVRFMQFYNGQDFEYLLEGFHRSGELRHRIQRLLLYRSKGITTLQEARLYRSLQQKHETLRKEVKAFQSDPRMSLKTTKNITTIIQSTSNNKRKSTFTPIEIMGLPGYDKLSDKERDLCRNVRIVPLSYIDFKNTLVAENKKCGYLKLQTARKLLKIDVNKTRKLYDFLVQEGYVEKPES